MKRILSSTLALILLFTCSAPATDPNPFKVSDDLDKAIQSGLYELYNLNFEKADQIFDSVESHSAEHPMVAFGKASVEWWRLSVYVLETDEEESRAFLKNVDRCIELSKAMIERGDPTGEGYLTLGGAYGLLGRWQATNQKYVAAYRTGRKAIKFLRIALKINPQMLDANMGLGIFDYYVATLPAIVRMLAFLGSGADPQVGITELTAAAYHGTYAQTPSKLFLVEMYSNPENKPEKALEILKELRQQFPTSSFIHMLHIIAYYNHQHLDDLNREAASFKQLLDNHTYRPEFSTNAHFALAMTHFKIREWDAAIEEFDLAIKSGTIKNPFYTWSYLYKGFALDAKKQRDDAVKQYQEVLKQMRRWGSHDAAKKYLSKPFEGTDEQLAKIRL